MALVEAEVEGTISPGPEVNTLVAAGVTVKVDAATVIRTPSKKLTIAELFSNAPFPGRAEPGFIGGTAIATGEFDTLAGVLLATDLHVEPAENVLVGPVASPGAGMTVNGVPVVLSTDPRLPASPVQNEFGFEIVPTTITADSTTSAEGYFASGQFYSFLVMADDPAATLVNSNPQVSVTRAILRRKQGEWRLDMRGAVTMAHAAASVVRQVVEVYRVDAGVETLLLTIRSRRAPGTKFGRWSEKLDEQTSPPPTLLRVYNRSAPTNPSVDTEPEPK